ncbi:MAG: transposase, partial [Oscillospiraceae bacterium]|nr:transposase [Oscillospiraceae bacterium]
RRARKKSASGVYHVILRGINRQTIFEEDEDYRKFLEVLRDYKQDCKFDLYAYCLMSNHIHLLLRTGKDDLGTIFIKIGARFVLWYNTKYCRTGHLFQDRYKSEPVDSDDYFLTVMRYIHRNPVKAGICDAPEEYRYSSYPGYFSSDGLIDDRLIVDMLGADEFRSYTAAPNDDLCMEDDYRFIRKYTDEQAQSIMHELTGCESASDFLKLNAEARDDALKSMLNAGISIRQTSRLTGVSPGLVRKNYCRES